MRSLEQKGFAALARPNRRVINQLPVLGWRANFEMHHYRQALLRMRQGDSDRDIAATQVMGRPKAAQWRRIAPRRGLAGPGAAALLASRALVRNDDLLID